MTIQYRENNSGGRWWLTDKDWHKLEEAGWLVDLSTREAMKEFPTPGEGMREFELITSQDVCTGGCECCGPPHCFNWTDDAGKWDCASGDMCWKFLYGVYDKYVGE